MDCIVEIQIEDIVNAPLPSAWDYVCRKYGYYVKTDKETVEITLEDLEYIGYIEMADKIRHQMKHKDLFESICLN